MVKVSGKKVVGRSPAELWRLLMSPEVLRKCIQGCEELEVVARDKYRIVLRVGLGPVKGRFHGQVALEDVVEPRGYRLELQAKGAMGFLRATTRVDLQPLDGGGSTEVSFESETLVGGMLGALGSRFFEGAARSLVDEFFGELSKI
jgi:carbon monoxide dehydrogenase subunit G